MKPQESNNRDPLDSFPKVARFRFHMRALEPIVLPAYAGSAWRGILGQGILGARPASGHLRHP